MMKLKNFFWSFLILFLFASNLIAANKKNLLVLHSYNTGLGWTDNINRGIFESFQYENQRSVDIRCEYLDAKRYENQDYFDCFEKFMKNKYAYVLIDAIICSDNAAFNFLVKYRDELFPNVPVLFCGLNYYDDLPKGFTGIIEDIDIKANLETILKLEPSYNKLYIINDRSITATSIKKELDKVISNDFPQLRYEYLTDFTLPELQYKLKSLQQNDVVLMLLFNFDRLGQTYSYDVFLEDLMPYCKVPVFGTWDFYLGQGIVGGKLASGYDHGKLVSQMAKKVLNGDDVNQIPIVIGPTQFAFDYRMMQKYNISLLNLPPNSKVIHLPYGKILENKLFFILLTIILVLLITLIVVLLIQIRRTTQNLKKEQILTQTIEAKGTELKDALEKAEQSNRLKAAFLANLSHEIRTPMNGIVGFVDLLQYADDDNTKEHYLNIIHKSSDQLLAIINDLVEIALIESHQAKVNCGFATINQMISELLSTVSLQNENENNFITGTLALNNGEDTIWVDEIKLRQILTNLLTNANKFTQKGTIEIGYSQEDKYLIFYVKDSGIGINPAYHEVIFERFRKADHSVKKEFGGTGLGLAISKAYVELLGGKIWLTSELGKGTTFYFTIPYVNEEKVK